MRLSISNSDTKQWLISWLLAVLLLFVLLFSYEKYLESKDYLPSVATDKPLWNWYRKQARNNSSAVVLVGASRIQLGIHTDTMRSLLPEKSVIPLAVNGHYPMATLQNLAADEAFKGLVLLSFSAQMLEPRYWDMQEPYVRNFSDNYNTYKAWDSFFTAQLKSQYRFFNHELELKKLVNAIVNLKKFPVTPYVFGQADGSVEGHYHLVDTTPLKKHFIEGKRQNYQENPVMDRQVWSEQTHKLYDLIQIIRRRGGEVVLIRFPTDNGHWALDERYYPRQKFWDDLLSKHPDIKAIHFNDDAVLRSFSLPDTSHLDVKDAKKFTARLVEILSKI